MTRDERVDCYLTHGDHVQCELLKQHSQWDGHVTPVNERAAKVRELEAFLASKPFKFGRDRGWHGLRPGEAIKVALKSRKRELGTSDLDDFRKLIPVMVDFQNQGIHGSSFMSRFLHQQDEEGTNVISDDRFPVSPNETELPMLLASYSLEMLAHEFGERPLFNAMLNSARTEAESHRNRLLPHFPTALLPLEL